MAISATQIATTNTLENFRQQFNNLQTDVNGLESGTLTFSTVSATTTSTSALNILEDGTIVFEGATDDGIGEPLSEFSQFQIKIVMQGTDAANPPLIKDLRILALAT